MKVTFNVGTMYTGSTVSEVVELDDDLEDDDIEVAFQDWIWSRIESWWDKES